MQHQPIKFSECAGGEWEEESIPLSELIPSQSFQDTRMVELLYDHGRVQGISSNKEGDRTCVSYADSFILDQFPLREKDESLTSYVKRVFGYSQEEDTLTEEQKEARDKLKQYQMNQEWKTMHAYHFPEFRLDTRKSGFIGHFDTSSLRRQKEREEKEEEESHKRARIY